VAIFTRGDRKKENVRSVNPSGMHAEKGAIINLPCHFDIYVASLDADIGNIVFLL
jgi:hypothetical protein